ncbi:aldo/keto reductase [Rhizobium favelukesii]|nr:aldo/keto reductase [Rhizobium sp. T1473]MCS0458931.1 aldo/keto reductase [Rhizobium favelukesii]
MAEETGISAGQIAIAWLLHKGTLPIIGPRTPAQLSDKHSAWLSP